MVGRGQRGVRAETIFKARSALSFLAAAHPTVNLSTGIHIEDAGTPQPTTDMRVQHHASRLSFQRIGAAVGCQGLFS